MRDEYRALITQHGYDRYETLLVVFKASEKVLRKRIEGRRAEHERLAREGGGYEGMSVDVSVFWEWIGGFEWPVIGTGEEGVVVEVQVAGDEG